MGLDSVTIDMQGCARCDGDGHPQVEFKAFRQPVEIGTEKLTHWATCPTTGEPILMAYGERPGPARSESDEQWNFRWAK